MPRPSVIENHPERERIETCIVSGTSFRDIAERYGLSKTAVARHAGKLPKELAKADEVKQEIRAEEAGNVWDEIRRIAARAQKMYDACDEFLEDPDRPGKYFLGPRAEEVEVSYYEEQPDGNRGPTKKATLDELLAKVESGKTILGTRYRHADPRELLLKTAMVLSKQIELITKVSAEIREQQAADIERHPEYQKFKRAVLAVLSEYPGAAEKLAKELEGGL